VIGERLLEKSSEHEGVFGFSVYSSEGVSVEHLARAGGIENKKIGVTSVAAIRELGFDVVPTSGRPHHATVSMGKNATLEDYNGLSELFEQCDNPRVGGYE
jgi:hypothetical protein